MNHFLFGLYMLTFVVLCIIIHILHKTEHFDEEDVIVISADGLQRMAMAPFKGLPKLANPFDIYPPILQQQLRLQQQEHQQLRMQQQQQQEQQQLRMQQHQLGIQKQQQQEHQQLRMQQHQQGIQKQEHQQLRMQQQQQEQQQLRIQQQQQEQQQLRMQQQKQEQQQDEEKGIRQQQRQQQQREQEEQQEKPKPPPPTTTTTAMPRPPTTAAVPSAPQMEIKRTTPEYRMTMLDELNNVRQCYNLQPLQLHDILNKSAEAMAHQIVQRSFNPNATNPHIDYDNKTPDDRAKDAGWNYNTWVGENISYNPFGLQPGEKHEDVDDWVLSSARASIDAWLCSKGHRDALLDPFRTHVGIAYASGTLPNLRSLCVTPLGTVPNTPVAQYTVKNSDCNFQCKDAANH
jgi:uncharacterized protein YkwD